ncbi:DUF7537 family lipoprotein [Halomarina rubra]|uniref:Uncharacterized protein n=1 Tax=Halomarina rubra TaxID=2071873 RepID=A0ABD6AXM2_9EURY|nr:hypothetical protein [Halomarina rubra]
MALSRPATVLLCLTLVLAGCGAGPGSNATTDGETVDGAGTVTGGTSGGSATTGQNDTVDGGDATGTTEASVGANGSTENGTTENGTVDATALAARHERTIREAGSVTVVVDATTETDQVRSSVTTTARLDLANDTNYQRSDSERSLVGNASNATASANASAADDSTEQSVELYTADDTTYLRVAGPGGDPQYEVLNGSQGGAAFAASADQFVTLQGAFDVVDATTWTESATDTEGATTYTASGPEALDTDALFRQNGSEAGGAAPGENASDATDSPAFDPNVSAYEATLVVSESGVVERFAYTLTVDIGGRTTTLARSYEVRDVGETSVEAPDWLPAARQQAGGESAGNQTGTAAV